MPDPIRTSHQGLINLANRECGYRNVYVDNGDSGRWSNKGNLVIEHNRRGTEEVCQNGRVISGERRAPDPYQHNDRYRPDYRQPEPRYYDHRNNFDATIPLIFLGGALLGAALSD